MTKITQNITNINDVIWKDYVPKKFTTGQSVKMHFGVVLILKEPYISNGLQN